MTRTTRISELRRALVAPARAAVAAVAAYAVSILLGLPEGSWAALSALIVSRPLPGAATQAGVDRLTGTLIGGGVACAAALLRYLPIPEIPLLAVALAPLTVAAAWREGWRTAPIAAVIVLSAAPDGRGPETAALLRIGEIAIGAVVGVAAAWLVAPANAERAARGLAAETLRLLRTSLAATEAADWTGAAAAQTEARAKLRRLARVVETARWEKGDAAGRRTLLAAVERLRQSAGFALRAAREPDMTAAAEAARTLAARDAAALGRMLGHA